MQPNLSPTPSLLNIRQKRWHFKFPINPKKPTWLFPTDDWNKPRLEMSRLTEWLVLANNGVGWLLFSRMVHICYIDLDRP